MTFNLMPAPEDLEFSLGGIDIHSKFQASLTLCASACTHADTHTGVKGPMEQHLGDSEHGEVNQFTIYGRMVTGRWWLGALLPFRKMTRLEDGALGVESC